MAIRILNARSLTKCRPVAGKQIDYFDSKVAGLALRVSPTGARSWNVLYRHRGRARRLTLGSATVLSLATARERARDALRSASGGADPAAVKQHGRQASTMRDLAELYIEKHAKQHKRSWRADQNLLTYKVLPRWRNRAIADIARPDVLTLVEAVADGGAPIVANRVAALLSKMFNFALDRGLVPANPAVRIPRPGAEQQRDRVLDEQEIQTLWRAFEALPAPMAAFYKLRLLTAQRGGEVAAMRWADVDLESGWWTVPATTSKNKKSHRVPLNASAATILAGLLQTADQKAVFVLEANYRAKGMGARGKRQQAEAAATFAVENFRGHDLRRTAASLLTAGGVSRLTVSKILNHAERGVTAVYDRHSYDPEKKAALTWWDAKLAAILANEGGRVLPFQRSA